MKDINSFRVFTNDETEELKEFEKNTPEYFGYVYFFEYGNLVKIGYTKKPYQRIATLKKQCEGYADKKIGRVAFTPMCTNYAKIEKDLHELFRDKRKERTELFDIDFYDAVTKAMESELSYLDETKDIEEGQERVFAFFKNFLGWEK